MRTLFLSLAAVAALAVGSNTADAQWRGRGRAVVGRPYYGGYSYARPYYGGYSYARPYYGGYSYARPYYGGYTPYYNNYVTPAAGFSFGVGNGFYSYPSYGYGYYPGSYWW